MPALTKTIDLGDCTVTVRELTVAEVRAWLREAETAGEGEVDIVGEALMEECSFDDLARMSDLAVEEMDDLAPSEIAQVIAAAREVNPAFFGLRDRLLRLGAATRESGGES